jgi:hypothetical protein
MELLERKQNANDDDDGKTPKSNKKKNLVINRRKYSHQAVIEKINYEENKETPIIEL